MSTRPINGGANTDPTAVPALMIPIAVDRRLSGTHSATTRVAAGNAPPSPIPSRQRAASRTSKFVASPCRAQAPDHHSMIRMNPFRVPRTSSNRPPPAYNRAYGIRNANCSHENCWLLSGIACSIAEIATGKVCRAARGNCRRHQRDEIPLRSDRSGSNRAWCLHPPCFFQQHSRPVTTSIA